MSNKIVIRVDASIQIGSGHVMRCLTLANRLREKGADITFICREHDGHLIGLIESSGYLVQPLQLSVVPFSRGTLPHAHWLGSTELEDALQTTEMLKLVGDIKWLIVDHYALSREWEAVVRPYVKHIMVIDDLADREHECDLLLDQNYYEGLTERYVGLVPTSCKQLLGPSYALLRNEFYLAKSKLKRSFERVRNVLIFFGGADQRSVTMKVALELTKLIEAGANFSLNIILGPLNPTRESFKELSSKYPQVAVHMNVQNMAKLISEADIIIGAGGTTTWERCYLGAPSIVVVMADNQAKAMHDLDQIGAVKNLGDVRSVQGSEIRTTFEELLNDPDKRKKMSDMSLQIMDLKSASAEEFIMDETALC
jgi:UDP-2,4-diacetamido-2,4,6-trideoxy-beta-L-altropyranose hydrolase